MQRYVVRKYDPAGRVVERIEFDAAGDAAAESVVGRLEDGRSQELWCGARWIATWPSRESVARSR